MNQQKKYISLVHYCALGIFYLNKVKRSSIGMFLYSIIMILLSCIIFRLGGWNFSLSGTHKAVYHDGIILEIKNMGWVVNNLFYGISNNEIHNRWIPGELISLSLAMSILVLCIFVMSKRKNR
jgi:hypothetical protein